MGSMHAVEMSGAVKDGQVNLTQALTWHLQSNHYPPIPVSMVRPCILAIRACESGDDDRQIGLPKGISYRGESKAPACEFVRNYHLDSFLSQEEE